MYTLRQSKLDNVEDQARKLAQSVGDLLEEEQREMADHWTEGKKKAEVAWKDTKHTVQRKGREADRWAHDHVWETAAISVALGAALGALMSSSKKRGRRWR